MNHSITYFNHVKLEPGALLGDLDKAEDLRLNFLHSIERVAVGSFAIGSIGIPGLQLAAYIAAKYSMRRMVDASRGTSEEAARLATVHGPAQIPIFSFRTQQIPIGIIRRGVQLPRIWMPSLCGRIYPKSQFGTPHEACARNRRQRHNRP